jgi:hypothetical protein
MTLDLTEEETAALERLLREAIEAGHYPLSPSVQTWRAIPIYLKQDGARVSPRRRL